jgi:phage terminase large subunit GpA-like protein
MLRKRAGRPKKIQAGDLANLKRITEEQKLFSITEAFTKNIRPSEKLDINQWADKYRILPQETSSEFGKWRTNRFPFIRRFQFCMSPQSIAKMIVAMKGHQLAFTEAVINAMMYNTDQNPGPMLYIQKTKEATKEFVTQKFEPSIRVTDRVAKTLGANKHHSYSDGVFNKGFAGGFISLGGANSGSFLKSKSIRDAFLDEEDSYELNIDNDGSPVKMVLFRQSNFPGSKTVRISTPKIKETSTIEPAYEAGSMEKYYIPCPHCNPKADRYGNIFVIIWEMIKYSDEINPLNNLPIDYWLECPHCMERIEEEQKTWMLDNGRWLSDKGKLKGDLYEVGDVEYPSFHISSLYSPYGFYSWLDAIRDWFDYNNSKDKAILQALVNQVFGKTYSLAGQDISGHQLSKHKEDYINLDTGEIVEVPNGVLILTAGIDIQADRIEVEICGWGLYGESWSIDYAVFWGNTGFLGNNEGIDPSTGLTTCWTELDRYLLRRWKHVSGVEMPVECVCIDSQYKTEQVHVFCRLRENRHIFPGRGEIEKKSGYIKRPKKRHERFQTWLFYVMTDTIKDQIHEWFKLDHPGPGYCHFPNKEVYDEKYFYGLTIENKKIHQVKGQKVLRWENPSGGRNEPWDCRVYSFGALQILNIDLKSRAEKEVPIGILPEKEIIEPEIKNKEKEIDQTIVIEKREIGNEILTRRGSPGL